MFKQLTWKRGRDSKEVNDGRELSGWSNVSILSNYWPYPIFRDPISITKWPTFENHLTSRCEPDLMSTTASTFATQLSPVFDRNFRTHKLSQ